MRTQKALLNRSPDRLRSGRFGRAARAVRRGGGVIAVPNWTSCMPPDNMTSLTNIYRSADQRINRAPRLGGSSSHVCRQHNVTREQGLQKAVIVVASV